MLIDPEGNFVGQTSGEGNYELLDKVIGKLIDEHKKKKTLDEKPIRFDLAKFRENGDTPAVLPRQGAGRREGQAPVHRRQHAPPRRRSRTWTATRSPSPAPARRARRTGAFDEAQFDDPQGMALDGDTLYVADRKNHMIRELDLKAKTVKTIAGTGEQDRDRPPAAGRAGARSVGLNSPWDLLLDGDRLLHRDGRAPPDLGARPEEEADRAVRRQRPREHRATGRSTVAQFAQPSGLATDGKNLYVADSEVSAVRKVPLDGRAG